MVGLKFETVVDDKAVLVVNTVEGGIFSNVKFVDRGKLDVAVFGYFNIVFEEKTPDVDELDLAL